MNLARRISHRVGRLLKGRDRGSVAIQFVLTVPILMIIVGVIVQYALLVNAHFTLRRALASAARSAMTSLPTNQQIGDPGGPGYVERSALMTLEALSPKARTTPTADAQTVMDALIAAGLTLPDDSYAARYTYAQEATLVSLTPITTSGQQIGSQTYVYAEDPSPLVRIRIAYDFRLTVPLVNKFIGRDDTIGGISGRFVTITSFLDVQLSPGREARQ